MKTFLKYIKTSFFTIAISGYAFAQQPLTPNFDDLERELSDLENKLVDKKPNMTLPSVGTEEYGALAKNETPMKVNKIVIDYSHIPPADIKTSIDALIAGKSGTTQKVKDIVALVSSIEKAIINLGYPQVRVLLPAQELEPTGADVRIVVYSAHVGDINVYTKDEELEKNVRIIAERYFQPLQEESYLPSKLINERLILLRDAFGLQNQISISRGTKSGTFDLNLRPTFTPKQSIWGLKDNLGEAFGYLGLQYSYVKNSLENGTPQQLRIASVNSFLQRLDTHYRTVSGSYSWKMDNLSTMTVRVNASATMAKTVDSQGKDAYIYSTNTGSSWEYQVPVIINYAEKWNIGWQVLESKAVTSYESNPAFLTYDKTRDFALVSNYTLQKGVSSHSISSVYKKGFDGFDATTVDRYAHLDASRLINTYTYNKSLGNNKRFVVNFYTQYSFNNRVVSGQKFSGTGYKRVGGGVTLSGDSGIAVSDSYYFSPVQAGRLMLIPNINIAYAKVFQASLAGGTLPPAGMSTYTGHAKSAGIGVNIPVNGAQFELMYSYGESFVNTVNTYATQFTFTVNKAF